MTKTDLPQRERGTHLQVTSWEGDLCDDRTARLNPPDYALIVRVYNALLASLSARPLCENPDCNVTGPLLWNGEQQRWLCVERCTAEARP